MNIVKEKRLGAGAYGDVYKVIDKNNGDHVVAVKAMKNDGNNDISEATVKELINTQNLAHPNIIPVDPLVYNDGTRHAVYINDANKSIELSLEMMNGDINTLERDQLTPEVLRKLVYDVTKGLYHMHSMGYIHNDLKPVNILYKLEGGNYTFKIGDFGLSQYLGIPFPSSVKDFLSTATVKAPNSENSSYYVRGNRYNYNSDMFSLGATMFWICMNVHGVSWLKFRVSEKEVFVDVRKKNFLDQADNLKAMYGEEGYDFLVKCMAVQSSERMSSKRALEHPYLRPLRGGAYENILKKITRFYKQPTMAEITEGIYELEFLDDMYNCYKDRTVNLYVNFAEKTDGILPKHMPIIFDWLYTAFDVFKFPTLESLFQTQLNYINVLNSKRLDRSKIQLWSLGTLTLCHKLLSELNTYSLHIDDLMWVSRKQYTEKELMDVQKDVLRTLNGNIEVTPVMFFLKYWYLKSIYTGERKEPNINVLNTSIAAMLAIMVSNTKSELENVKLDDLAKYCVKKALVLQEYTEGVNVDILGVPTALDTLLDTCITEFCGNVDINSLQTYTYIKGELNCTT
jgi:hypothetical protein